MGPLEDDEEDAEAAEHGKGGARRGGAKLAGLICVRDTTKHGDEATSSRPQACRRTQVYPEEASSTCTGRSWVAAQGVEGMETIRWQK